jgi:hypothetical protein
MVAHVSTMRSSNGATRPRNSAATLLLPRVPRAVDDLTPRRAAAHIRMVVAVEAGRAVEAVVARMAAVAEVRTVVVTTTNA